MKGDTKGLMNSKESLVQVVVLLRNRPNLNQWKPLFETQYGVNKPHQFYLQRMVLVTFVVDWSLASKGPFNNMA